VPYATNLTALASVIPREHARGPERMYLVTGGLVLTRDAVARDRIVIDERCLLTGRVVAHDGRGLARAKVHLTKRTSTGPMPFFCTTSDDGGFTFVGMSGDSMTASAVYHGAESPQTPASVGGGPITLHCPTNAMRFLRVVNGSEIVSCFELSGTSLTFCHAEPPWLPRRGDGIAILPPGAANMYICWSDSGGLHEAETHIMAAPAGSLTNLDLSHLTTPPLGQLRIHFGNLAGLVTLSLVKPGPTPGFAPLQAGLSSTQGVFCGIRPGTYRFGIKRSLFEKEARSAEVELTSGLNEVRLAEILR